MYYVIFLYKMRLFSKYRWLTFWDMLFVRHASEKVDAHTPRKLVDFVDYWLKEFYNSNIPEADASIRIIVSHVLSISRVNDVEKFYDKTLTKEQQYRINHCCECRLARIPIQYIIKEWDFRSVTLKMAPPVFIPRPETESLVDLIKQNVTNLNSGLEIGCGSGAISVSLLKEEPQLKMTAIDQSNMACRLTVQNAGRNYVNDRLTVYRKKLEDNGQLTNFTMESYDFIVSNPPYLFSSELHELQPEIKLYEDLNAVEGGHDGLRLVKAILLFSSKCLMPSKACFLEVHDTHGPLIETWLNENTHLKLKFSGTFKDIFGVERFVFVVKM